MIVGRLAPTPSGHLHLGNALAFGAAWLSARAGGGRLLLRIEDLDRGRARDEVAAGQRADLRWLGLDWDEEVAPQSRRDYSLDGLPVYRCDCNRAARLRRACRCRERPADRGAWRFRTPPGAVEFVDRALGAQRIAPDDDPVVMRAGGEVAYPLAVVVDDARDGVTEVVRGADLLEATAVQIRIHERLGLSPPTYLHTPLLLGADGKKLSKSRAASEQSPRARRSRDLRPRSEARPSDLGARGQSERAGQPGSTEIRALRAAGWTPLRIWQLLLPYLGLPPGALADQTGRFSPDLVRRGSFVVDR